MTHLDKHGNNGYSEVYTKPFVLKDPCVLRPCGTDYDVEATGFSDSPGGILSSHRISRETDIMELVLSTPEDDGLPDSGLQGVTIDGVSYVAINPEGRIDLPS